MKNISRKSGRSGGAAKPPFIGALLRLTWQRVRGRMHAAIRAKGFDDLLETHYAVFTFPLPDGVRPSDLARQIKMTRQAANYVIGQMEELGYLERRAVKGSDRRLVYLTKRGWQVADVIYEALREVQEEWAQDIGPEQFENFMNVLRHFALDAPAGDVSGQRAKKSGKPELPD